MLTIKVRELKIGTVLETGEIVSDIRMDRMQKWVRCIVVNRKTNQFRPMICKNGKNIIVQSL